MMFTGASQVTVLKNPLASAGDTGSTLVWEDPLEKGNDNSLQYSCLENSMDRGACGLQSMGSQSRT